MTSADPAAGPEVPGPPGVELASGFAFRPARDVPEVLLDGEARRRVDEKMDSVNEARLRAAREAHTAYIG